jgi:hypothetical protein
MPRIAFTDLSIKALKPELRTDYWDTKTPGFGLRVGKNSKTFLVKRDNRRITIGRFPDWTLQEARAEAKRLLLQKSSSTRITVAAALDLFVSDHLIPGCLCGRYVPLTDKQKPVNRYLGRARR